VTLASLSPDTPVPYTLTPEALAADLGDTDPDRPIPYALTAKALAALAEVPR
jgi:hypothetical protein